MPAVRPEYLRIGELAKRSGVSVATIKFYIREGLLPPAPVKTGRTMGYYDQPYLDRLLVIRRLREEHFLPLGVIRSLLDEHGDKPMVPAEAAVLARIRPAVTRSLVAGEEGETLTRGEILRRYRLQDDELALLEELGLVGERIKKTIRYTQNDLQILDAFDRAQAAGLSRERFPATGIAVYVEHLGELARREVRLFLRYATANVPPSEIEAVAERAVEVTEPILAQIRRKLLLRALHAELAPRKRKQESP